MYTGAHVSLNSFVFFFVNLFYYRVSAKDLEVYRENDFSFPMTRMLLNISVLSHTQYIIPIYFNWTLLKWSDILMSIYST